MAQSCKSDPTRPSQFKAGNAQYDVKTKKANGRLGAPQKLDTLRFLSLSCDVLIRLIDKSLLKGFWNILKSLLWIAKKI